MLLNSKGVQVRPDSLPSGKHPRELALKGLREVLNYPQHGGKMHTLSERATLKTK